MLFQNRNILYIHLLYSLLHQVHPCGFKENCIISDSPEVSPIPWIQCEGKCISWHHVFLCWFKSDSKGKYIIVTILKCVKRESSKQFLEIIFIVSELSTKKIAL